ncbi:cytochrome P450 2B4 [Chanos chanos]|uniref:Cytochrome P450 2B4 n=1 Tax=Chanos chanos TaxID=29144 RepID=A0A6J2WDW7_CHACN|nr:cytochrome P450 2B4-like [Chanos chanos]
METILKVLNWSSVGLALLLGFLSLVLYEIVRLTSLRDKFPPGPKPWPFVGNLPQLLRAPMRTILGMPKYGEIGTIYVGRQPSIILNEFKVAKEALVQNSATFSGRPSLPVLDWITDGLGIVMAKFGHSWRQQRRFALHTLRNFGLGKKSVEERIAEEARYLTEEMLKFGKPFDPIIALHNAVSNIICSVVFGNRFEYNNKRFTCLLEILHENIILSGSYLGQIFNMMPFLKYFPGPHQKIKQNADQLKGFIQEEINKHRKTLDPDHLRDFIDAYLVEIERQQSKEDSTFFEENMVISTADLFLAGTDTTSTTLRWGIIYMMENPEIQERCHKEIVRVVGYDRSPSMDDREVLPYTYATIHEIQRCGNIAPLGVVHETTQPTQLRGYHIPKGTWINVNLSAILTDKDHWKYPDTFNPENFLDEKGQFCKQESFLPFSLGPRVCLGETLARMELFLFFTSLLQRVRFSWPDGSPPPDMEGTAGIVRGPRPFKIMCHSRDVKL